MPNILLFLHIIAVNITQNMVLPKASFGGQSIPAYARTADRAVHVKIHPRPRNLAESREVLRILQQYGEVVMYKHLKVHFCIVLDSRIHC